MSAPFIRPGFWDPRGHHSVGRRQDRPGRFPGLRGPVAGDAAGHRHRDRSSLERTVYCRWRGGGHFGLHVLERDPSCPPHSSTPADPDTNQYVTPWPLLTFSRQPAIFSLSLAHTGADTVNCGSTQPRARSSCSSKALTGPSNSVRKRRERERATTQKRSNVTVQVKTLYIHFIFPEPFQLLSDEQAGYFYLFL